MVPKTPKILQPPQRIQPMHNLPTQSQTTKPKRWLLNENTNTPKPCSQPPRQPLHHRHTNRKMPNLQRNKKTTHTKIRFKPLRGLLERLYRHSRTLTVWSNRKNTNRVAQQSTPPNLQKTPCKQTSRHKKRSGIQTPKLRSKKCKATCQRPQKTKTIPKQSNQTFPA